MGDSNDGRKCSDGEITEPEMIERRERDGKRSREMTAEEAGRRQEEDGYKLESSQRHSPVREA
jgi:hypothetical protein